MKNLTPYTLKALAHDFRITVGALEREQVVAREAEQQAQQDEAATRAAEDALRARFDEARAQALDLTTDGLTKAELTGGFEELLKRQHRFAYDHVRRHEGPLLENLEHVMIRPYYHEFLARKLLPPRFHSFAAWRGA